jgi:hypothetical protein
MKETIAAASTFSLFELKMIRTAAGRPTLWADDFLLTESPTV